MVSFQSWAKLGWFCVAMFLGAVAGCDQQPGSSDTGKSKQVIVEVSGMTCSEGCAPRAREALAALPWAKEVSVSFNKKQATLVAESEQFDEDAIVRVLKDAGFDGKILR